MNVMVPEKSDGNRNGSEKENKRVTVRKEKELQKRDVRRKRKRKREYKRGWRKRREENGIWGPMGTGGQGTTQSATRHTLKGALQ